VLQICDQTSKAANVTRRHRHGVNDKCEDKTVARSESAALFISSSPSEIQML